MIRLAGWASVAGAMLAAAPARAQDYRSVGVEVTSDEVRRGLSWSEGRASASADVALSRGVLEASARIAAIRESARHGGAGAVADLAAGGSWDLGAFRLRAEGIAHLFAGARPDMDYVELAASGSYSIGPARLTAVAVYAPAQRTIGGSNLYLHADADAGIPGTPLTLLAGIGHSTGGVSDPLRAQRLRPGGAYTDWRVGVEHRSGMLTLGVHYLGTDVARGRAFGPFADAGHAGDRLVGRARLAF